ncbi:hypothetical protein A2454_03860 [Candidatus Peribacteria bacterium RIFOXYC2_FULL_55_14]|nr:MAG: hypothetical protein UY85_C0018G0022 [Candidatus Peribacteria bacterium GW2011_GWB1_54_5]OGJ72948.1 MAG: hypothetical protein A2217_06625 [Candidatus Peribacteria bacterium RIFOXYA2_FULL_55_28]OGJ80231.1 MAG: hypothetical protein A2454_03860 [Candidatus Peribacteria bacterium RIFOXYC2_FULL_55_14]
MIDDTHLHSHSLWILKQYGLIGESPTPSLNGQWTAALWPLILGLASEYVFASFPDPYIVRHAVTFALLPVTVFGVFIMLRKAGFSRSTSLLGIASLLGIIRFGGHAFVNLRDFPHAASFVLVSLGLWLLLHRHRSVQEGYSPLTLFVLGSISTIPFLTRSPELLHFCLILAVVTFYAVGNTKLSPPKRILHVLIPLFAGIFTIGLFSPMFWHTPVSGWLQPFRIFSRFPAWYWKFYMFGIPMEHTNLPWWYLFAWIPVIVQPVTLLAAFSGWYLLIFRKSIPSCNTTQWNLRWGNIRFSLMTWLTIIIVSSWIAFFIIRPYDYGEDRHIHFLYPLFFLVGTLALDTLTVKTKYAILAIMMVWSTGAYIYWGKYSYVYKSPVILNTKPDQFNGDYRGACITNAIDALQDHVPHGATVTIYNNPMEVLHQQRRPLHGTPRKRQYHFRTSRPEAPPYAFIQKHPTLLKETNLLQDVEEGRAQLLWAEFMPPGSPACVIAWYP